MSGFAGGDGILFGPNPSGKTYLSAYIHRGLRPKKSMWASEIKPDLEYHTFCLADEGIWCDALGNYWGVRGQGTVVLGQRGERLCKFPRTVNAVDPWHGYPTSPLENGDPDCPPTALVVKWRTSEVINRETELKILKRKI